MEFPFGEKDLYIDKQIFEKFLNWLDTDQNTASVKYEKLQERISYFFKCSECWHPDECTVVTLNRVARKVHDGMVLNVSPIMYILGFARKVLQEYNRKRNKSTDISAIKKMPEEQNHSNNFKNKRNECLKQCLNKFPDDTKNLLYRYKVYKNQKKQIAKELGISVDTLKVKIARIVKKIKECVDKCIHGVQIA